MKIYSAAAVGGIALLANALLLASALGICEEQEDCPSCLSNDCFYLFVDSTSHCISKGNNVSLLSVVQLATEKSSPLLIQVGELGFCSVINDHLTGPAPKVLDVGADVNVAADASSSDNGTVPAIQSDPQPPPPTSEDDHDNHGSYIPQCNEFFNYWTFFSGIFLGLGIALIGQGCYGMYRSKRSASYNEPFRFDTFVNP